MTLRIKPSKPPPGAISTAPFTRGTSHDKFQKYLTAAARTVDYLEEQAGLDTELSSTDRQVVAAMAIAYAKDPMGTSKKAGSVQKISTLPPPAVREAHRILSTFGHSVVDDAVQVRHMVTNKLIEETENVDPRVRLKALELLGKVSDVGLFSDKSEVTVTHQTSDDLRARLKEKLAGMIDVTPEIVTPDPDPDPPTNVEDIEDAEEADEGSLVGVPKHTKIDTSLWDD